MNISIDKAFAGLLCLFVTYLAIGLIAFICYLPKHIQTQAICLEQGYTDYTVSYAFKGYCKDINGIAYSTSTLE